jgi:hypothetical protein
MIRADSGICRLPKTSLPTAPLHATDATTSGSGKSMLDDVVAMLVTGRTCDPVAETKETTELEKRYRRR